MIRLVRFQTSSGGTHIGSILEGPKPSVVDLTDQCGTDWIDIPTAYCVAQRRGLDFSTFVLQSIKGKCATSDLASVSLCAPVEAPEVWAAGVTYERSRHARNSETKLSESVYDRVYDAERPELFLKATGRRVTSPGAALRLRSDSHWMVPEPELAMILSCDGTVIGYTVGNDLSSRDIEGENPLYLPQAKIFNGACSFGPAMLIPDKAFDPYTLSIRLTIQRGDVVVFWAETTTRQLKRRLEDLIEFLLRDNEILSGTVLFTGTGIVPPDDFTLCVGDQIDIDIPEIGTLTNTIANPLPRH